MAEVISIFNFLKEYNELSNPVITELENQKWSLNIKSLPKINEIKSVFDNLALDTTILEVGKPIIKPCPHPGDSIVEWINNDWKKINEESIEIKSTITRLCENADNQVLYNEERFEDDETRQVVLQKWMEKRKNWRESELPREEGLYLYNNLFKLYSDMKKELESVELILGDGILVWDTESGKIRHPVLLQKVQLYFDPNVPSFKIFCEELSSELYTPLLRIIPSINQMMLSEIIKEVESNAYHLADYENTSGLFRRIINVVDKNGSFLDNNQTSEGAMIYSSPVLFLRKRTLGYSEFIANVIDEIDKGKEAEIPTFFQTMAGNYKETKPEEIIEDNWNESGIDEDILLTLPANNEQLKIIKYLNRYGAVLVQGPPGTGKTHTIANLIGHLLSQGNSVLVTSQKEKALTVLKEKVFKDPNDPDMNLQNLCISLLSSKSQKKEMDNAINEIAAKGTSLDLNESKKQIEKLRNERSSLIELAKKKKQELLCIRSLEYTDLVFDNHTISPVEAAKFIRQGINQFDYIKGLTKDDTIGLPITREEIDFIYNSNDEITVAEEKLLGNQILEIEFWSPSVFNNKQHRSRVLEDEIIDYHNNIEFNEENDENSLRDLLDLCKSALSSITEMDSFHKTLTERTIIDDCYSKLWMDLLDGITVLISKQDDIRKLIFSNEYLILDDIITSEMHETIHEIISLDKEVPLTKLSLITKPKWKKIKESITKRGKTIEKRQDFINIYEIINYELKKAELIRKIELLSDDIDSSIKVDKKNFEAQIKQYNLKIINALSWHHKVWREVIERTRECINYTTKFELITTIEIDKPIDKIQDILSKYLIPDISIELKKCEYIKARFEWNAYLNNIGLYKTCDTHINDLFFALENNDIEKYTEAYYFIENAKSKKKIYDKRQTLLTCLGEIAPDWANDIRNRIGIHGESQTPNEILNAWKWRQLSNQLHRIDGYDPNKLQKELEDINKRLLMNASYLAYEKAWFEKIKSRTDIQAQAIEGWRTTIRLIGKGTGKNAPALRQKARELMPLCQSAIPVWIMPLNRVVESFNPKENKFDVIIIDEASQSDILALSALYLGKKIIIVGDDEQVSPDSVGLKTDEINALIAQHLQGIPNNHLFNAQTSLYDMAKSSGFKPLMLTEHFRSVPEIIGFSNGLSYNYKIKPLRDATNVSIKPAVVEYRVPQGCRNEKKINENEAEHIASLVCACVKKDEYKGKSIGVISLLGAEQSNEVDKLLQSYLDPVEYERRNIQCGTPAQFQGDERDVIFLSIVDSASDKGGPIRLLSADGKNDLNRKRYNVAASRAKDQMWVVHSLNPEMDLKADDIRLRLIRYALNPQLNENEALFKKTESPFESEVLKTLIGRGYKVIPQFKAGSYRIDMVIKCGDKRIALECDGEKWHGLDKIPDDLRRQAILERLGWRFIRIRGSAYYRDPDKIMEKVFEEINKYDIHPDYSGANEDVVENHDCGITEVKRLAVEIRREWHGGEIEEPIYQATNDFDEIVNHDNLDTIQSSNSISKGNKSGNPSQVVFPDKELYKQVTHAERGKEKVQQIKSSVRTEIKQDDKPIFDFRKRQESMDIKQNTKKDSKKTVKFERVETAQPLETQKPIFDFRNKK